MCDFVENVWGLLELSFGIGVSKVHEIVGHRHHLFNCTWADFVIYRSVQKAKQPCAEHVLHDYGVLLRERSVVLDIIVHLLPSNSSVFVCVMMHFVE